VRSSVAYAVSAIAHWDWPEAWPGLFQILMEALTTGNSDAVHGAMRVLTGGLHYIKSTIFLCKILFVKCVIKSWVPLKKRSPNTLHMFLKFSLKSGGVFNI